MCLPPSYEDWGNSIAVNHIHTHTRKYILRRNTPENAVQPCYIENCCTPNGCAKDFQGIDEDQAAQSAVLPSDNAEYILSGTKVLKLLESDAKAQVGGMSFGESEAKGDQH